MASLDPQFRAEQLIQAALLELRWGRWIPDHAPRSYLPDGPLLVGFSGGSDSLALLLASVGYIRRELKSARPKHTGEFTGADLPVIAIHVDHRLRPDSSDDARRAAALAQAIGCRCEVLSAPETDRPAQRGGGIEDYAREIRYGLLRQAAARHRASAVLVGHTEDDQAETLLLSLAHGAGSRAQGGMKVVSTLPATTARASEDQETVSQREQIPLLRPFLGISRQYAEQVVEQAGLDALADPTNDPDGPWRTTEGGPLPRIAVRHQVLPALAAALGQDPRPSLARLARLYREDDDALTEIAASTFAQLVRHGQAGTGGEAGPDGQAEHGGQADRGAPAGAVATGEIALPISALQALPPAIERRVLALAGQGCQWSAREITHRHFQLMQRLVRGGSRGPLNLPGGVTVGRRAASDKKPSEQMIVFSPARG